MSNGLDNMAGCWCDERAARTRSASCELRSRLGSREGEARYWQMHAPSSLSRYSSVPPQSR